MARVGTAAAKSAFELIAESPSEITSQEQANREPRYLFFAGDEPMAPEPGGMQVQTPVIRGGMLWRCAVTPAINAVVRSRLQEIPVGRLLDGTADGRGLGAMLLPCGPEVEELINQYGHADVQQWQKRWGLVELTALRGMVARDVAALNLTEFFFPGWPDIPATNKEVIAHLEARLEEVDSFTPADKRHIAQAVGEQMLNAVKMAQTYQTHVIQDGNIRITFPDSNDRFKPAFDGKDELFSLRSGAALAVNSLRGNQSDAMAAGIGDVLDKVLSRVIPQQQTAAPIDAASIAAIVAATVQALKEAEAPKVEVKTASQPTKKPNG